MNHGGVLYTHIVVSLGHPAELLGEKGSEPRLLHKASVFLCGFTQSNFVYTPWGWVALSRRTAELRSPPFIQSNVYFRECCGNLYVSSSQVRNESYTRGTFSNYSAETCAQKSIS
eukprot:548033-Amphidinium_carterae.1